MTENHRSITNGDPHALHEDRFGPARVVRDRAVAAGALIGNRIGRNLDKSDEACLGHALELGATGQPVSWTNESTGVSNCIVPGEHRERDGSLCRELRLTATVSSQRSTRTSLACESGRGILDFVR
jgi:surface antigen